MTRRSAAAGSAGVAGSERRPAGVAAVAAPAALPGVPTVNRCRPVQLWGGPEDGATVMLPPGELPARIGVHRTAHGDLVPIRGRALVLELPTLPLYEQVNPVSYRHWCAVLERDDSRYPHVRPDEPLYLWAQLPARWAAR